MVCSNCGKEVAEGKHFCTSCGAAVGAVAQKVPAPGTLPLVQPVVVATGRKRSKWLIIVPVAILLAAGIAVGLVLLFTSGSKLNAKVVRVDLLTAKDEEVDLKKVPLDKELKLSVEYRAKFPEEGQGRLHVRVVDSEGEDLVNKRIKCISKDGTQTYSLKYTMTSGTGKPVKVKADVEVTTGKSKASGSGGLTYVAEKGGGETAKKEAEFKYAHDVAAGRIQEGINAVKDLTNQKIDATGLPDILDKANFLLKNATNVDQLVGPTDSATFYANSVINECNNRKAVNAQQQAAAEAERKRQQAAKQAQPSNIWVTCSTCNGSGGWYQTDEMGYTGWVT